MTKEKILKIMAIFIFMSAMLPWSPVFASGMTDFIEAVKNSASENSLRIISKSSRFTDYVNSDGAYFYEFEFGFDDVSSLFNALDSLAAKGLFAVADIRSIDGTPDSEKAVLKRGKVLIIKQVKSLEHCMAGVEFNKAPGAKEGYLVLKDVITYVSKRLEISINDFHYACGQKIEFSGNSFNLENTMAFVEYMTENEIFYDVSELNVKLLYNRTLNKYYYNFKVSMALK